MTLGGEHPNFPIDWDDLFERIGDEDIIVEFALSFIANGEKLMFSLGQAIESGDPQQIELYAHAMKGAASNIGAISLAKASWQLETAAAEKHLEKAVELFNRIAPEFETLKALLQQPDWVQQAKVAVTNDAP
jgi:HPt (histidine-containing phosphotransfer) domain-containing protein